MTSAAIYSVIGGRSIKPNWGMSILAADLHDSNRREVARAEFEDPREVTVTFATTDYLAQELLDMQVEGELHIGAGGIAYVIPVVVPVRGLVMHVTCKSISVRLFSQRTAGFAATMPRKARVQAGIALGQSIRQPPRLSTINTIGAGATVLQLLSPWTTAIQLVPVKNGAFAAPDMTIIGVEEVHATGPADPFPASFQYEYQAIRAMDVAMPLHHWATAIKVRNGTAATCFLHLIEHWQL